jgi:hypothetical protein
MRRSSGERRKTTRRTPWFMSRRCTCGHALSQHAQRYIRNI